MTRDDLEARVWAIAGRHLTGRQVDDIVAAAEAYAVVLREEKRPAVGIALRHEHSTDLYPVIAVLAEALMPDVPQLRYRMRPAEESPAA